MNSHAADSRLPVHAEARRTIRCAGCQLVQFETASGDCRRCHKPLFPDLSAPEPEAPSPVVHAGLSLPAVSLPDRLRLMRESRGMSQSQVAAKMGGVPRTYVSKLENGKATPTLTSLARIAAALGTTSSRIIADDLPLDPFSIELTKLTQSLTEDQRNAVLAYARGLAEFRRIA